MTDDVRVPVQIARNALNAWHRNKPANFLDADPNVQVVLQMHMGERYHEHWPRLNRAAGMAAGRMNELANEVNEAENEPRLRASDPFGTPAEEVILSPAAVELGAQIWSTGVLEVLRDPGNELLSLGLTYLISHNGEAGHICPLACTAGLIKLLLTVGSIRQQEQYLGLLTETDSSKRLHASQFVTELQGGSDVGANALEARTEDNDNPEGTLFRLWGDKWFCSVADAGVFVVTARVEGDPKGTKGLGLFLIPRVLNGVPNNFTIRRLKPKLGTRALATGEFEFRGALAEVIGPYGDGFKNLVSTVLDTSRVHNAVAACGMMHRAFLEAQTYAQYRKQFGVPIMEFSLIQALLGKMKILTHAAVATTFRQIALGDRMAMGDEEALTRGGARRVMVMLNKYWTSQLCTDVVRMGIEVLGGNGTIEDFSPLPKLYRDAMVLETWEGAHNTLCAQVLRDFKARKLHLEFIDELRAWLGGVTHADLAEQAAQAATLIDALEASLVTVLESPHKTADYLIRPWMDRAANLNGYISMLRECDWELCNLEERRTAKDTELEIFFALWIERKDPLEIPYLREGFASLARTF